MSRLKITTIVLMALVMLCSMIFAAERMVLAEMFTNTGCGPCVSANDALDRDYAGMEGYLAIIRYHTWWPGLLTEILFRAGHPTQPQYRADKERQHPFP
jgi:hypothetical protein